jgi:hypothetical protein
MKTNPDSRPQDIQSTTISLHPLKFTEAVADILKVKPEPKQSKALRKGPRKKK